MDQQAIALVTRGKLSKSAKSTLNVFYSNAQRLQLALRMRRFDDAQMFMQTESFQIAQREAAPIISRFVCNTSDAKGQKAGEDQGASTQSSGLTSKSLDLPTIEFWAFVVFMFVLAASGIGYLLYRLKKRKDRRAKRYKTFIQTALRAGDREITAIILDLSCNGAKL